MYIIKHSGRRPLHHNEPIQLSLHLPDLFPNCPTLDKEQNTLDVRPKRRRLLNDFYKYHVVDALIKLKRRSTVCWRRSCTLKMRNEVIQRHSAVLYFFSTIERSDLRNRVYHTFFM